MWGKEIREIKNWLLPRVIFFVIFISAIIFLLFVWNNEKDKVKDLRESIQIQNGWNDVIFAENVSMHLEIELLNSKINDLEFEVLDLKMNVSEIQSEIMNLKSLNIINTRLQPRIFLNNDELELFYYLVQAEAGVCDKETKEWVASVVINRCDSELFPNTLNEVIYQRNAFSPTFNGMLYVVEPTKDTIDAVNNALYRDVTNNALYFMNPDYSAKKNIDWMRTKEFVAEMCSVEFYKEW